jgi:hypothetical protein
MARVVTEDEPRDTVVVEREGRSSVGTIVLAVIAIVVALWLFTGVL